MIVRRDLQLKQADAEKSSKLLASVAPSVTYPITSSLWLTIAEISKMPLGKECRDCWQAVFLKGNLTSRTLNCSKGRYLNG